MIYKEVNGDVFDYHDKGYWLVHCISADFALGAGIAKEIDSRYGVRSSLLNEYGEKYYLKNDIDCICIATVRIFNLVTKNRYWQKPTLDTMKEALKRLRAICRKYQIRKITMPKIGCGLDKLRWDDVSDLIKEVFRNMSIEVVVCYL